TGGRGQRGRREWRARAERHLGGRRQPGTIGAEPHRGRKAALPLARAGAQAGVALHALHVRVALADRLVQLALGDVLAGTDDRLVVHGRPAPTAFAAPTPARVPGSTARGPPAPA